MPAATIVERLRELDVAILNEGPRTLRFVTHLDVDDAGIEHVLAALRRVVAPR